MNLISSIREGKRRKVNKVFAEAQNLKINYIKLSVLSLLIYILKANI